MIKYAILNQDSDRGYNYYFKELGQDEELFKESLLEILTILGKRGWILGSVDKYGYYIFYKEI